MYAVFAVNGVMSVFANLGPSPLFVSPSLSRRLYALAAQSSAQPLKRLRDEDFCTIQQVSNWRPAQTQGDHLQDNNSQQESAGTTQAQQHQQQQLHHLQSNASATTCNNGGNNQPQQQAQGRVVDSIHEHMEHQQVSADVD